MSRLMADCRRFPSDTNCSLVIIGEEDEVARAAAETPSQFMDTRTRPSFASRFADSSSPPRTYSAGPRANETLPG